MAARATVRRRSPAPRRRTAWIRSNFGGVLVPSGNVMFQDLLDDWFNSNQQSLGATVVRIRGVMNARPAAYTLATSCRLAAVVDSRLHDPSASTQGPMTNENRDWMLFEPFVFQPIAAGGTATDLQHQVPSLVRTIDVKAMRKLEEMDETLLLIGETSGQVWNVSWDLSLLLMLP